MHFSFIALNRARVCVCFTKIKVLYIIMYLCAAVWLSLSNDFKVTDDFGQKSLV
jgi:hypothetical protein